MLPDHQQDPNKVVSLALGGFGIELEMHQSRPEWDRIEVNLITR